MSDSESESESTTKGGTTMADTGTLGTDGGDAVGTAKSTLSTVTVGGATSALVGTLDGSLAAIAPTSPVSSVSVSLAATAIPVSACVSPVVAGN